MRVALEPNSRISLPIGGGSREFVIDDAIGSGATCIVYSAHYHDTAGHRRVVRVKECYPYDAQIVRDGSVLLWNDSAEQSVMLSRFGNAYQKLSEIQNTKGLRNSTAHVFDLCEANGTLYSVMDVTEGKTFDNDIGCSLQDCLKTTLALTRVIEKYHANGYLHLDIKPGNFLVIPETRELVILFDLDTVSAIEDIQTGMVSSIPYSKGWAAPEQMQGKVQKLCPATDLYAIGTILFERVFGRAVNSEDMGIFAKWDYDESLCANENPKIRRLLTEIFHKTLSANIRNRYQSASELAVVLEETIRVVDKGAPYLVTSVPTSHINFVGRQEELRRISNTFDSGKKCVFLQGFGGIGKTELAKKYTEAYADSYDHIVFLRYSEKQRSIKSLLLDNIQIANYEDDRSDNEIDRRKKRLEKIKELLTPYDLIILDNYDVETPDNEFMELLDWNTSWLVATRSDFSYLGGQTMQLPVEQMEFSDLLEIFRRESRQQVNAKQAVALEKLFAQFDNYTMVVTLLAKQVYAAGLTIEELCDNEDVYDYEERVLATKDAVVTQDTLIGHLQRVFNMGALSEEQQEALRTVWMMRDANEITKQFYKKYSGLSLNPLNTLISLGWLQYDSKSITLHPVIAQLIEHILDPCCENCPHLYHTFLGRLLALIEAIDADDYDAYTEEIENLFRIYVFMNESDTHENENLRALSQCLLEAYEMKEVPEFMWFLGWENQGYFIPKIIRALSAIDFDQSEVKIVFDEDEAGSAIFGGTLTLRGAEAICAFSMMQFELISEIAYEDEYDIPELIYLAYAFSLGVLVDSVGSGVQTAITSLLKRAREDCGYYGGGSIGKDGRFNADYEDGDPYPFSPKTAGEDVVFAPEDWYRLVFNPHNSICEWVAYRMFYDVIVTVLTLHQHNEVELSDGELYQYKNLEQVMRMEIMRNQVGYDHFYDFYATIDSNDKDGWQKLPRRWIREHHFCHSNCDYYDEGNTNRYFEEIVQALKESKHPAYLYKLLVNKEFRVSNELKQRLVDWGMAQRIIDDSRLTNEDKDDILRWTYSMVLNCEDCSKHCSAEGACWPALQRHVIEGIVSSW